MGVGENDEKNYDENDDACEAMLKSASVNENDEKNYDKWPDMIGKDCVGKLRKHEGQGACMPAYMYTRLEVGRWRLDVGLWTLEELGNQV